MLQYGISIRDAVRGEIKKAFEDGYLQTVYADTDSVKENNMIKDFIVVHDDSEDGAVMIIRKSAIVAVTNEHFGDETYCNIRTENTVFRVTEPYAEVVKRLFE